MSEGITSRNLPIFCEKRFLRLFLLLLASLSSLLPSSSLLCCLSSCVRTNKMTILFILFTKIFDLTCTKEGGTSCAFLLVGAPAQIHSQFVITEHHNSCCITFCSWHTRPNALSLQCLHERRSFGVAPCMSRCVCACVHV